LIREEGKALLSTEKRKFPPRRYGEGEQVIDQKIQLRPAKKWNSKIIVRD